MRFETSTIKDIAKALGLSTSTVSRALRDRYEISEETKKLVLAYAEKVNYRANPIARSLKERRSYSIGIIVSEIANNFFSQVINGIESIAYDKDYHVIISQSHESFEQEKLNVDHLASRSIDGLLIALSSETQNIDYLRDLYAKGLPIVFFDRVPENFETHKVIANNFKGSFDATEHLILSGKRTIAHLTNSENLSITRERLKGYQAALAKYHIDFNPDLVKYCQHGGMHSEELETAVKELLPLKPDGIFIASDRLTTGCIMALKNTNPEFAHKIAIAGFTNSNLVELFSPSLTSVRQPAFEMGQVATELLISMIEAKRPVVDFETRILDTELIKIQKAASNKFL
ncbi:LacI family DNA-binding transcriptional regulator [Pedobacter rhizosphaerae]|uniref:Transcriptional regulator, LacI family n=1 Tax=Pedobacter rhizosphaerae TaxID=390241 RepID=A0A1H9TAH5_9SPHI|nr:LacI family DNA-binding transcriptional regulator [Pedobacter rhizosphaerae]SER94255.1 transcriptional regulator, LacI family [Pedobacter rhizosphaerae]